MNIQIPKKWLSIANQVNLNNLLGCVFCIDITDLKITLYGQITSKDLCFSTNEPSNSTIYLIGPIKAFLNNLPNQYKNLNNNISLTIKGDLEQAQLLAKLFFEINLQWSVILMPFCGNVMAYKIANFINYSKNKFNTKINTILCSAKEYANYETDILASSFDVNNFINNVDILRDRTALLEQRINILSSRVTNAHY